MDENCYRLIVTIIQLTSLILVIATFSFDIRVKRNIAKQTIVHDWYKSLILPKIESSVIQYFAKAIRLYEEYCDSVAVTSDLEVIKGLKKDAVIKFQNNRRYISDDFLGVFHCIDPSASNQLTDLLEKYEDECIEILEKSPLSEVPLNESYTTKSYEYQQIFISLILKNDKETLKNISRS